MNHQLSIHVQISLKGPAKHFNTILTDHNLKMLITLAFFDDYSKTQVSDFLVIIYTSFRMSLKLILSKRSHTNTETEREKQMWKRQYTPLITE